MTDQPRQWKTRLYGTEYGPFTLEEMLTFILQGRVSFETEVQHPTFTQQLWLKASVVKPLRDQLNNPTPPPVERSGRVESSQVLINKPSRREQSRLIFRWILFSLWGPWLVFFALWLVNSLIAPLQHGSAPLTALSGYLIASAIGFWALLTAVPLTVVSVITYFFTHD